MKYKNFEYIIKEGKAIIIKYKGNEENIVIPSKIEGYDVTEIGVYAFANNDNIKSVVIPSSVNHIRQGAFWKCSSLTSVELIKNDKDFLVIGVNAFEDCFGLTNVYYTGTIENWCNISFNSEYSNPMRYASCFYMLDSESNDYKEVKNIEIPSTVTTISEYQFCGFTVTSFTIDKSLLEVCQCAFKCCTFLEKINYSGTKKEWKKIMFNGPYSNPCEYAEIIMIFEHKKDVK